MKVGDLIKYTSDEEGFSYLYGIILYGSKFSDTTLWSILFTDGEQGDCFSYELEIINESR